MLQRIEEEIKTMPNYFSDYDTTVHFISEEELTARPQRHSARRFRDPQSGKTGWKREHQSCDRVQPEAGFQPGIYLLRDRGLCQGGLPSWPQRDRPAARPCLISHRLI